MPDTAQYLKEELYRLLRTDSTIFEFLQKGSLDGVWYWDIENPEREWLSPEFKALFGYRDGEVPSTSAWWQENIHPDDLALVLENFEKHCEDSAHPYDQVVRYRHKDGSTVWVRCRGIAIRDEKGKAIRLLGAHTDVTPLKRAEEALERTNQELLAKTQELERQQAALLRSNQMLERYAYGVSHDFREPLRTMGGFSTLLAKKLEGLRDPEVKEFLGYILSGVERLESLSDALLEHARLSADKPSLEACRLDDVVGNVLKALQRLVGEYGARVEVAPLPETRCDPRMMELLFQNLVQNAILHASVKEPLVRVSGLATKDGVELRVDDNGQGVPENRRSEVFQMFRSMGTGARRAGLGLAICETVARHHGGRIRVEQSELGGASFRLALPAA